MFIEFLAVWVISFLDFFVKFQQNLVELNVFWFFVVFSYEYLLSEVGYFIAFELLKDLHLERVWKFIIFFFSELIIMIFE